MSIEDNERRAMELRQAIEDEIHRQLMEKFMFYGSAVVIAAVISWIIIILSTQNL